ncbi:MAG: YcxB family protein [Asticcacaulis sp.]
MTDTRFRTETYQITAADTGAFFSAWSARRRFNRRNLIFFALVTLFFSVCLLTSGNLVTELFRQSLFTGLAFCVFAVVMMAAVSGVIIFGLTPVVGYLLQVLKFVSSPRPPSQSVSLSEEGLIKHQDNAEQTIDWAAVTDFVETRRLLLVHTSPNCALIVPKRAFSSAETLTAFTLQVETALTRAGKIRQTPVKPVIPNAHEVF